MNYLILFIRRDRHDQHDEVPLTVWVPPGTDVNDVVADLSEALNDSDACDCWCGPLTYDLQAVLPL